MKVKASDHSPIVALNFQLDCMRKKPQAPIDLSKKLSPFLGKWVAMSQDRQEVIASASTFKKVLAASQKKRPQHIPLVLKVSDKYAAFLLV